MSTTVFITGGTGSLGSRLVTHLLNITASKVPKNYHCVVFSRDEQKQYKMALKHPNNKNISFVLGDIRDQQSIMDAIAHYRPDIVIHTAAQKHVKICEHNPMQTVLTNIHGTKHVARACLANKVKIACFVSTDKVVGPTTLYGMTKHIAERIWANAAKKQGDTKFVGVRYGNILNSEGSLIPLYLQLMKEEHPIFPVTDERMTRFFITFTQAISLIMQAVTELKYQDAPEIYTIDREIFQIPKLPAIKIIDIANIFAEQSGGKVQIVGAFESEKLSESLVQGYNSSNGPFVKKEDVHNLLIDEDLLPLKE